MFFGIWRVYVRNMYLIIHYSLWYGNPAHQNHFKMKGVLTEKDYNICPACLCELAVSTI